MTDYPFIPLKSPSYPDEEMIQRSEQFLADMQSRRTVRDYSARKIPPVVIENAIRTAGTAPSGANMQPWHFVVVTNQDTRCRIREAAEVEELEFYAHRASQQWLLSLIHI